MPSAGRNCYSLAPMMSSEENDVPPLSAQNIRPQRVYRAGRDGEEEE